MKDVGKPKAVVAAARVMERVAGVEVEAHFCRIEEKDQDWYRQFHIIALGLDSVEARVPAALLPRPLRSRLAVTTRLAATSTAWCAAS